MFKQTAKFNQADSNETLTVVVAEGKSGFNIKASIKTDAGTKGAPKAKTGAREKFTKKEEAVKAFDKLTKEAVSRGWAKVERVERNAFSSIPAPTVLKTAKK